MAAGRGRERSAIMMHKQKWYIKCNRPINVLVWWAARADRQSETILKWMFINYFSCTDDGWWACEMCVCGVVMPRWLASVEINGIIYEQYKTNTPWGPNKHLIKEIHTNILQFYRFRPDTWNRNRNKSNNDDVCVLHTINSMTKCTVLCVW